MVLRTRHKIHHRLNKHGRVGIYTLLRGLMLMDIPLDRMHEQLAALELAHKERMAKEDGPRPPPK